MGRPSKLSSKTWDEIGRRLANGESQAKLAKEYKIARTAIVKHYPISDRVNKIKTVAGALATAELALERMSENDRVSIRTIADQLKGIQSDYAESAANGAATARHLTGLARTRAQTLGDEVETEDLRT